MLRPPVLQTNDWDADRFDQNAGSARRFDRCSEFLDRSFGDWRSTNPVGRHISYNRRVAAMDVLSDVLRVVRLSGAVFFTADFSSPWGLHSPIPDLLASAVMPHAE